MTIFEVFTYGDVPFGNLSNSEVMTALLSGLRPELPKTCSLIILQIVHGCWEDIPQKRITADEAYQILSLNQQ